MKRALLSSSVLALSLMVCPAQAQQNPQVQAQVGTGTMINGRIVRTAQDQFVVQGADNKQYTFYTNPKTTYWSNNNPIQYSNLRVGSNITTWYVPQGDRYLVNRVNLVPATTAPNQEPTPPPAAAANTYQGEVIRVGNNQVVIRTAEGKEIIVYTNPQTTYRYDDQPATITQFQPGVPVRVDYIIQDNRPYARGILGLRRR